MNTLIHPTKSFKHFLGVGNMVESQSVVDSVLSLSLPVCMLGWEWGG